MIKYSVFCLLLLATTTFSQNNIDWAKSMVGDGDDFERNLAIDNLGNVFFCGSFNDTLWDFNSNSSAVGTENSVDGFFAKRNPQGNIIWLKGIHSTGNVFINAIEIDNSQNILITGHFIGEMDLDPSNNTFLVESDNSNPDIFIAKYDSNGDLIWGHSFGSTGIDHGVSIGINSANEIIVAGEFEESVDFDPSQTQSSIQTAINRSVFVIKLTSLGELIWINIYAASGVAYGETRIVGMSIDSGDNISLLGRFNGEIDFDHGVGNYILDTYWSNSTVNGNVQIFVTKINNDGEFIFAGKHDAIQNDNIPFAIVNDELGNTYYCGYFRTQFDIDPTPSTESITSVSARDGFVIKLNSAGALEWYKVLAPNGSTNAVYPYDIAYDDNGGVYVTGLFAASSLDFTPEAPGQIVLLNNQMDFIWKIEASSSNTLWAVGTLGTRFRKIATQGSSYFFTLGYNNSAVNIDPNSGTLLLPHVHMKDIFLAKYKTCSHTYSTISVSECSSYLSPSGLYTWNESGMYSDTINSAGGCDSIITVDLTIYEPETTINLVSICEGDSFVNAEGITYTDIITSFTDTAIIQSSTLCDSTIITSVTIVQPDTSIILNYSSGALVAHSSNDSFQWVDCDNSYEPISGGNNQVFIPSSNGSYAVIVETNSCIDTSQCFLYQIVNTNNLKIESEIQISPNPTEGNISINLQSKREHVNIIIRNTLGQVVSNTSFYDMTMINTEIVGESGVYFIEIIINNLQYISRIVKS